MLLSPTPQHVGPHFLDSLTAAAQRLKPSTIITITPAKSPPSHSKPLQTRFSPWRGYVTKSSDGSYPCPRPNSCSNDSTPSLPLSPVTRRQITAPLNMDDPGLAWPAWKFGM